MITTTEGRERTYHLWYDHYNRRRGENQSLWSQQKGREPITIVTTEGERTHHYGNNGRGREAITMVTTAGGGKPSLW